METINFGKLVEDAVVGTQLIKITGPDDSPVEEYGIWMNSRFNVRDVAYGLVFNSTRSMLNSCNVEETTQWRIRKDSNGEPMIVDGLTISVITALATERINYRAASTRADDAVNSLREFKSNAQAALHDWADGESISENESMRDSFNELLESIGLEQMKREFIVNLRVTYDVQVTVEATSSEAAQEEVDNDMYSYLSDAIDVGYYDDYEFGDIEEA